MSYIYFTEEEKERARTADIAEHRRLLSEVTYGFINMRESAVMR